MSSLNSATHVTLHDSFCNKVSSWHTFILHYCPYLWLEIECRFLTSPSPTPAHHIAFPYMYIADTKTVTPICACLLMGYYSGVGTPGLLRVTWWKQILARAPWNASSVVSLTTPSHGKASNLFFLLFPVSYLSFNGNWLAGEIFPFVNNSFDCEIVNDFFWPFVFHLYRNSHLLCFFSTPLLWSIMLIFVCAFFILISGDTRKDQK